MQSSFPFGTLKKVKLTITVLLSVLTGLAAVTGQTVTHNDRLELVGMQATMAERLGTDDGMSFAIHFGGETHGSLEPCG